MHVRINTNWIIPQRASNVRVAVYGAKDTVRIFLPEQRNGKILIISQCSTEDIIIDCNSHIPFNDFGKDYSRLVFTGAKSNMGKSIQIIGKYNKWNVDTRNINSYFEGLQCQVIPSNS